MESNPLNISIKDITKKYGDFYALKEINLEVMSGEFLTLLGPSGSGKTTLLMALAGFTSPDYGSIKFGIEEAGTVFAGKGKIRRKVRVPGMGR